VVLGRGAGLSFFHVVLPLLVLGMLLELGYDPRALPAQTVLGEVLLVLSYLLTDPSKNINWVYGPGPRPQARIPRLAYLGCVMVFFPAVVYWPTHLLFRRLFPPPG
jgi:hypothetical protein